MSAYITGGVITGGDYNSWGQIINSSSAASTITITPSYGYTGYDYAKDAPKSEVEMLNDRVDAMRVNLVA